jgi:hypothetical protein
VLDYGVAAACVAVWTLYVALGPARPRALFLQACAAVAVIALLNTPVDSVIPAIDHYLHGQPTYAQGGRELTPNLYGGLIWIRQHAPSDAVVAVNNQYVGDDDSGPFDFYYSAISQRRVFLEGFANSERAIELGWERVAAGQARPFPGRLRLNRAVFAAGNPRALSTLIDRYGVRYLVVDEQAGPASPRLARLGRLVFARPGVVVYAVGRGL